MLRRRPGAGRTSGRSPDSAGLRGRGRGHDGRTRMAGPPRQPSSALAILVSFPLPRPALPFDPSCCREKAGAVQLYGKCTESTPGVLPS